MSSLRNKFVVCSDLHSYYGTGGHTGQCIRKYQSMHESGYDVHTCGDFAYSTSGLISNNGREQNMAKFLKDFASLGGLIAAGNHDAAKYDPETLDCLYGGSTVTVDGITYTGRELWDTLTGAENGVVSRTYNGGKDVYVALSMDKRAYTRPSTNADVDYSSTCMSKVKSIVEDCQLNGQRLFVFLHFPTYFQTSGESVRYRVDGVDTGSISHYPGFATRYGTSQTGNMTTGSLYPNPHNSSFAKVPGTTLTLLEYLSVQPGVIVFSGHQHNDWRLQEESLTYVASDGHEYKNEEPMPALHYVHVPNGAYMVNLPSLRYRDQDAVVEVYDDKVVVKARGVKSNITNEWMTETDLNGTSAPSGTTWDFVELGAEYVYNIPLSESEYAPWVPTGYALGSNGPVMSGLTANNEVVYGGLNHQNQYLEFRKQE